MPGVPEVSKDTSSVDKHHCRFGGTGNSKSVLAFAQARPPTQGMEREEKVMRLLSALFDTVLLPLAVLKDCATVGGDLIDEPKSATRKQIEKIEDNLS